MMKSQDVVKVLDRVYGLDQILYNGKKYNYFLPSGTKGHQYIISPDYIAGSVTLKGKCYQDILLNYDLLNQQLLLKYEDESGARNVIELSESWIKSFRLANMNFEFLNLEKAPCFYQVLGNGSVRILYHWRKNLNPDIAMIGSSGFGFTPAIKDSYILIDGELKQFRTKRGLIRIFDGRYRSAIKSYLRKNKVKVNKATDQVMEEMITFIDNIR